jgi:hypothetical protein
MSRTWSDGRCPDCGQKPKSGNEGFLRCACPGKRWERIAGLKGTPEEEDLLKAHGFQFARSANDAEYYVGPYSRLVWFNYDGTWSSEPRPSRPDMPLEEYLEETDALAG